MCLLRPYLLSQKVLWSNSYPLESHGKKVNIFNLLYCIVLYCIVLYCIVPIVLYCIVMYCIVLYCIVPIVLYCIVLYCTYCTYCNVLYCTYCTYCIVLYCTYCTYCNVKSRIVLLVKDPNFIPFLKHFLVCNFGIETVYFKISGRLFKGTQKLQ